jgi:probable rRNA maturation factor
MVDLSFTRNHITSVSLPFLSLEIFADEGIPAEIVQDMTALIQKAWPFFLMVADQEKLYDELPLKLQKKVMEVELIWTNNTTMRGLNLQYRQIDKPTDVLTFTMLADADEPELWMSLPVLQLGSVFISLDYAQEDLKKAATQGVSQEVVQTTPANMPLEHYLLERFIHGMLHLFGMHHDTMEKYEKVVHIQKRVLEVTFEQLG